MQRAVLFLALIISSSVVTTSTTTAAEPKTWERSGRDGWEQVNAPAAQATQPATAAAAVPALDRVEQLLQEKKSREAKKLAIDWVVANRDHPQRDRGLFLVAQSLYQYGNRIRAFYYLDELMDTYPDS